MTRRNPLTWSRDLYRAFAGHLVAGEERVIALGNLPHTPPSFEDAPPHHLEGRLPRGRIWPPTPELAERLELPLHDLGDEIE